MNPTVLRAGTADVIAHVFYAIGFRPRESLVVVGLSGPRRRLGLTIRTDLPSPDRHHVPLGEHVRHLRDHGDDAVIVLVISDRPDPPRGRAPDESSLPRARLARAVGRQLSAAGFEVLDLLAIGASTWRSYTCENLCCCPPGGRPLDEVVTSPLAAWHVARGDVLAADEASLLADVDPRSGAGRPTSDVGPVAGPAPPPAVVVNGARTADGAAPGDRDEEVDHVANGADDRPAGGSAGGSPADHLSRWRALLRDVARGPGDTAPDVTWLPDAFVDRRFRDAVLVSLLPDAGAAPDAVAAGDEPAALDGLMSSPPDPELLARGTAVLAAVARTAPAGRRSDALALLAWAAWWEGQGTRGRLLAARAMADDPGNTLATLVDQLLFLGVAPGWARRCAG